MKQELQNALTSTMMGYVQNPFLVIKVRRDYLIEDALQQIQITPPQFFKKPLKIKFEGEEGVDEGGLRKEFFQLLLEQLFNWIGGLQRSFVNNQLSINCLQKVARKRTQSERS